MRAIKSSVNGTAVHALGIGWSIRRNAWPLAIVVMALALRLASGATANASFFLLAAYALSGRAQAVQALTLSWLFSMLSGAEKGGIAPIASQAAIGRYAVIAAAALSVLLRKGGFLAERGTTQSVSITMFFGAFIIFHSWLFSPAVDVSVLKATAWTAALVTLLLAWGSMSVEGRQALETQVFGLLTGTLLVSLPLLFLPLGYLTNGMGFQGVLGQPQAFGPAMALLGAYAFARLLALRQPRWRDLALAAACLVVVFLSEARTAGLSLVLGVATAVIAAPLARRRSLRSVLPGLRSERIQLLALFAAAGLVLGWSLFTDALGRYVSKRSDATDLSEAYRGSRGALMDTMWANIEATPWSGIGFGIASNPSAMEVTRDPVLGLPTSASIEKGVVPLAVLEELGVPGLLFFLVWIGVFILRSSRNGVAQLSSVATLLLVNFGESTIFSPSGLGMIELIVLAWAVTVPKRLNGGRQPA